MKDRAIIFMLLIALFFGCTALYNSSGETYTDDKTIVYIKLRGQTRVIEVEGAEFINIITDAPVTVNGEER